MMAPMARSNGCYLNLTHICSTIMKARRYRGSERHDETRSRRCANDWVSCFGGSNYCRSMGRIRVWLGIGCFWFQRPNRTKAYELSNLWLVLATIIVIVVTLGGMKHDKASKRQQEIQWMDKARSGTSSTR